MGVSHFTSFVDSNPQLLNDWELCNCQLIVDGNNLYHFLYYYFKLDVQYAGEYGEYASCIESFFNILKECHVEPVVVFDGAYDKNGSKWDTIMHRAQERIHLAGFLSHGRRGRIMPILAQDVFRQTLNDLGIRNVTCMTEADRCIAALGREWNAPVLSNDSDFFVFDCPAGMVLLDYLNLKTYKQSNGNGLHLKVQLYQQQNMFRLLPQLSSSHLAIFAALNGTDTIHPGVFHSFNSKAPLPSLFKCKHFNQEKRHERSIRLLHWLANLPKIDDVISGISRELPERKRKPARQLLRRAIVEYTELQSPLLPWLETGQLQGVLGFNGMVMPSWIERSVRRGLMPVNLLNALTLHRAVLLAHVEKPDEPSVYDATRSIRQVAYALLLGASNRSEAPCIESHVEEYGRVKRALARSLICPDWHLNDVTQPSLSELENATIEERRRILLAACSCEEELQLDEAFPHLHVALLAARHWVGSAQPSVQIAHLCALICTFIKLFVIDSINDARSIMDEDCEKYARLCSAQLLTRVAKTMRRFCQQPAHNRRMPFDGYIVHSMSQFQASLQAISQLNDLLLRPLIPPAPQRLLSGQLFYNLYRELRTRADPLLYCSQLFERDSPLSELFVKLIYCVTSEPHCLVTSTENRQRKKTKHNVKATSSAAGDKTLIAGPELRSEATAKSNFVQDPLSDNSDDDHGPLESHYVSELYDTNKFSALCVE